MKKIILLLISIMMMGCFTQVTHPSNVNAVEERVKYKGSRNYDSYYNDGICVDIRYQYSQHHLRWNSFRNCWMYDPYYYNGYYNGHYNYWYWHHHNDHHDDDDYVPPSNEKKERRKNNYDRPSSNSDDSGDDGSTTSSKKKSNKSKRTKSRGPRK